MINRLFTAAQKHFAAPEFSGAQAQVRQARILHTILVSLEFALVFQFGVTLLTGQTPLTRILPLLLVFPFLYLLRSRIRPQQSQRQSIILLIGMFILTYSQTFAYGGVRSPAYAALTVLVLLAGLLLGFRAGAIVAAVSFLGGLILVLLEANGVLAPIETEANLYMFFISSITYMVVALTTLYLAVRDLREAYASEKAAIQDRILTRDALQQSEARYRAIVEDQTELINRHALDGTIVHVNEAYAHFYGHTPEEMIGQPLSEFLPPTAWRTLREILSRLTPEDPIVTSEHLVRQDDGSEIWLQWRDRLILDRNGDPSEYQGVGRDITQAKQAERELEESEEKFRNLAEKSPNMIFINQGGRIIYVNQACVDEMGYTRDEFYSPDFSFLNLVAPESEAEIHKRFALHQHGEEVPPYEARLITHDGKRLQAIHSTRLINIGGQPAILGIITDVTEQRQAAEALFRLNKAVEASGEVIFMTDPQGVFTYVNPAFTETYGYHPDEVIGVETPRILKSGQMTETFYQDFWQKILDRRNVRMEMINRTRTGDLLTIEASVNPIVNEKDEVIGFLAAQRDITERVRMQEDLRLREEQYRAVAESAFIGIGITDPDEVFSYVNPTLAQMLGYAPEELIGQSLERLVTPELFARVKQETEQKRKAGERGQYELKMRRADGKEILMQVSVAPLFNAQGEFRASLGVISDITDQRQAENELRRQLAELETLQRVANAAAESLDEDRVIERCTRIIAETSYPDHVGILLYDEQMQALRVHPSYHGIPDINFEDLIPYGEGITGTVVKRKQPLRVGDVLNYPGFRLSTPEIRSELCVPLIASGKVLGAVNAESRELDFFTEHDERLMMTIADLLATSIENARLYSMANEQRILAEALRDSAMAVNSTLDFDEVLDRILSSLMRVVPHDCANIMTLSTDGHTLEIIASRGYEKFGMGKDAIHSIKFNLQSSPHFLGMLQSREAAIISNIGEYEGWVPVEGMDWISSYMCAPIIVEDTVIGFVNLDSEQPDFFQRQHADRLKAFANQAAVAIENATLYQELERHSTFLEQAVHEATEDLRDSRDRIQTILASSPDAVLLLSVNGTIELCNVAFTTLFGFSPEEVEGQSLCLLASTDEMEHCNQVLKQVVEEAITLRFESTGAKKEGAEFDVDVALAPVLRDGTVTGVVCSIRDITEMKQVGRMKDAFVSNVSHELRTPITSLKLNHSLLKMNPKNGAVYLDRLEREIARLNLLIEDLLRLSRLEQGKVQLSLQMLDLNEIAQEYAVDRMVIANERQLSLFFEAEAERAVVYGDVGLIGQALSVLITNALNYTPAGGKIVVSTLNRWEADRQWAGIQVSDTGPGIPEQDMPYIFDRFYRGETGLTSGSPGTGLGLAIAQQILREHGGKIEASTKAGNNSGAVFTIWFSCVTDEMLDSIEARTGQHV
jgi:two-component system phosphate regulon sensor histidine kinase PhoR